MNIKLKQITFGGLSAIILTFVVSCNFSSSSSGEANIKNENAGKQSANSDTKKPSGENETTVNGGLTENIVGTWKGGADPKEKLTMTFNGDGSLDIETDFGDEKVPVKAAYRIIDEQTVEIKYSDGKTRDLTDIKISGNTMQAKGRNSKPGIFKRLG